MENNNLVIPSIQYATWLWGITLWWEASELYYSDILCDWKIKIVNNTNQIDNYYSSFAWSWDIKDYMWGKWIQICETPSINNAVKAYFSLH